MGGIAGVRNARMGLLCQSSGNEGDEASECFEVLNLFNSSLTAAGNQNMSTSHQSLTI